MNRLLKIIATVIGLIVLIVIIGIVTMILFINPNRFKPLIIKQVYQETGRKLSIPGNITWSFFPTISITTEKISLGNPAGYKQPLFLKANSARAQVRLFPLLSGEVVPKNIELSGAQLYLIKNKSGHANWAQWSNTPTVTPQKTLKTVNKQPAANSHFNIIIPNINIDDTDIHYLDETAHKQFDLTDLNLQVSNAHVGRPFPLQFSTHFSSKQPAIKAQMTANATVTFTHQQLTLDNLSVNGKLSAPQTQEKLVSFGLTGKMQLSKHAINLQPIQITLGDLNATGYFALTHQQYKGAFDIKPFDLNNLLAQIGHPWKVQQPSVLQNTGLKAEFSGDENTLTVQHFLATLGKGSVTGTVFLDKQHHRAKVSVFADRINTDSLQPAKAPTKTKQHSAASSQKIQLPTLIKAYNIAGKFSGKNVVLHHIHFNTLDFQLVARHGDINLSPLSANLYQGKLSGAIIANFSERTPQFTTRLWLDNINVNPLLADLYNYKNAEGICHLRVDLRTAGDNALSLKQQLNGQADLSLKQAAIKNLDLDHAYQTGLALLRKQAPPAKKDNQTHIGTLKALFDVKNGIAYNDNLTLTSHDFNIHGSGKINLVNNTLDYLLKLTDKQQQTIPLKLSGDLTSPNIGLDKSAITAQLQHHAEQHIRNEIQKKLQGNAKLKEALGKWHF